MLPKSKASLASRGAHGGGAVAATSLLQLPALDGNNRPGRRIKRRAIPPPPLPPFMRRRHPSGGPLAPDTGGCVHGGDAGDSVEGDEGGGGVGRRGTPEKQTRRRTARLIALCLLFRPSCKSRALPSRDAPDYASTKTIAGKKGRGGLECRLD